MGSYDDILDQVPIDQLAGQLGVGSDEVRQAAEHALPALLGGLQANASDPAGADSLLAALSDHQGAVDSLGDVDEQDGRAIVGNIFGGNTDQVVNQLGGLGGTSGSLVQKLLPLLAPIVMSWLAKKMGQGGLGGMLAADQGRPAPQAPVRERAPPTPARSSPAVQAPTADRSRLRGAQPRRGGRGRQWPTAGHPRPGARRGRRFVGRQRWGRRHPRRPARWAPRQRQALTPPPSTSTSPSTVERPRMAALRRREATSCDRKWPLDMCEAAERGLSTVEKRPNVASRRLRNGAVTGAWPG